MKIELFDSKSTRFLEDHLRSTLQIPEHNKVIVCRGLAHALAEAARGLHSVYPHRMNLVYQTDGGPDLENMSPFFSREGFPVHGLKASELEQIETVSNKLGKSGLFAAVSDDDPITGEIFDHKALEDKLADNKTFCIRISYSTFLFEDRPLQAAPFTVRILALSHDLAAIVLGSRANIDRLLFGDVHYEASLIQELPVLLQPRVLNRQSVVDFEAKAAKFAKPGLPSEVKRLYDRAVLFFEDVEGSALLDVFEKEMNLATKTLGSERKTETASLCRWGDKTEMSWLSRHGFKDEQIRGLIVLDTSLLTPAALTALEKSYLIVKKKQGD